MAPLIDEPSVAIAIVLAGVMLLVGMATGTWKYIEMRRSSDSRAPMYVDIAHRAALLYAFAIALLALLAALSPLPQWVEITAIAVDSLFFFIATGTYIQLGIRRRAHTQYRDRTFTTGAGTWVLAVAEIGSTAVLVVGACMGLMQVL